MYIFASLATPFIYLLKWIAELFLFLSNIFGSAYSRLIGASIWLNDIVEANVWPKE
jgi:hypothetical protein